MSCYSIVNTICIKCFCFLDAVIYVLKVNHMFTSILVFLHTVYSVYAVSAVLNQTRSTSVTTYVCKLAMFCRSHLCRRQRMAS